MAGFENSGELDLNPIVERKSQFMLPNNELDCFMKKSVPINNEIKSE